ncbi:MAG TPA: PQQ-binding-like beta-propeller repeat protein [Gemmataceae bacterium]|nr:PQQ-binding-like beta-propeller repeat protein [Gemmataceae bacterium]
MLRRSYVAGSALVVLAAALLTLRAEDPKPADKPAAPDDKTAKADVPVDILASVKEWNSDKFTAPPTQFRQGTVTPRPMDEKITSPTKNGFTIQLPSGAPIPTPSVYKGRVFVSGGFHSREYYCFDAETGKPVWGVNLDDDGPTSAACQDGVILFNTESCTIFALDAETGKQLWSLFLGDPLTNTPTIANGKVFTAYPALGAVAQNGPNGAGKNVPPCSHVLAAFDLKTGKILWQRWIDSDVMSAPVAVDKELYVTSFGGVVYKLNQDDGTVLSAVRSRATSAPVVVGDRVFLTRRADGVQGDVGEAVAGDDRNKLTEVASGARKDAPYLDKKVQDQADNKGKAAALDAGNGFAGGAPAAANPTAAGGNVGQSNVSSMQAFQGSRILNYVGKNFNCMGDEIVCSDPATGEKRWSVKLEGDLKKEGGHLASPPAAAGGQLFLTTLKGEVLRVDPADGKITARYAVDCPVRYQPAVEGGKIYVGTETGKVVCIDAGDAKYTGWPCWGANAAHTGLAAEK